LGRHSGTAVTTLALASALAGGYLGIQAGPANAAPVSNRATAGKTAQAYSAERLQALRAQGKPVFVNFTAAWCITCLVNERVALSDRAVTEAFAQSGITYLKGDWTNQDPQITRQLAGFGRSGVPLYVFYPAGLDAKPVVLPQLLTPAIVLAALNPPPG
jgi:thiol:disulfide interchange protein DsbD